MSLPGINVTAHGAQYRVSVQGFSGDHVLFLVDGERLTSEGNGVVDLNRIDMANVERIELISGAASALYGSNAIGGVINFITRRARHKEELSATFDHSSEGRHEIQRLGTNRTWRLQLDDLHQLHRPSGLQRSHTRHPA